jgi:hypothetical protein
MKRYEKINDANLRVDSIPVTETMLGEIYRLQTGCTDPLFYNFKRSDFNNEEIDCIQLEISRVMDIIIENCETYTNDKTEMMECLMTLLAVKKHYDLFRAQIPFK